MSYRINKENAAEIADKLLNTAIVKKEALKRELDGLLISLIKEEIPEMVKELYKDPLYNKYMRSINSWYVYYSTDRSTKGTYWFTSKLDLPYKDGNNAFTIKGKEDAVRVEKMVRYLSDFEAEIKSTKAEIISTLLKLGTYKRISEDFSEASKFLPVKENTQVMINIENTVSKIKKLSL